MSLSVDIVKTQEKLAKITHLHFRQHECEKAKGSWRSFLPNKDFSNKLRYSTFLESVTTTSYVQDHCKPLNFPILNVDISPRKLQ